MIEWVKNNANANRKNWRQDRKGMRALMDSMSWRNEAEMRDFHFDTSEVERVVNRLLPKYEPLLEKAQKRGKEEFNTTYDELRIEALDQILTRERLTEMEQDLDAIEQEWSANGINEATLLRIERDNLRHFEPSENRFLYSVLLGQIQPPKQELEQDETEDDETDESPPVSENNTPSTIQKVRKRVGNILTMGLETRQVPRIRFFSQTIGIQHGVRIRSAKEQKYEMLELRF